MQRVKLSLACLLCLSLVGVSSAQTELESTSGVATIEEYSGSATFAGTYFDIRSMTGNGVGYRNGYTQIGTLLPLWLQDGDSFIAPSNRLIVTDLGDVGYNGGVLYRRYQPEADRIFGANLYFDYDQSLEGFTYHQVGFGFEVLSDKWDARTNVYLPTTDDDNFVRPLALDCTTPLLQGNQIGFLATGLYQQSIEGVDFEVGLPLTKRTPWLRGYAGAYFYDAPKDNPIGVRARMEALISNDLSVGVNVTNDTNYGTNVNAVVEFRFAGWQPTRYFPDYTVRERMLASVQRNWRIATANTSRDEFAPAKNPDTGNPYFIVWVDDSNAGPGTGTFEDPYSDLPASAPGADIIVVKVGNTSLLNPLAGSIVLEDNQRLLGEGKAHQIDLLPMYNGLMCPVMAYNLPGIATDGNYPYLTSVGANDIVTLRNNNEVSAFNMVRAGGSAITNFPAVGSRDFTLMCLNLINNDGGGIILNNASGTGLISMVNAVNNTAGGISIDSAPAGLNLTIDNTVSSSLAATPGFPQAFGLELIANPGAINATITDSEFNRNTVGMILTGNTGDLDIAMTNVSVDDNITDGVQLTTVNSDVDLELRNSTYNRNGGFGLGAVMTGGSLDILARNVTFNNNDLDNVNLGLVDTRMGIDFENATFNNSSTGSGIVISNSGSNGTGTARLNNILSTGNFLDGFQFNGDNLADISATVSASVLSDNGRDAFSVSATNGAQVVLNVAAVVATGSGRHGLNFNATNLGDLDINFLASNLNNSGSNAALAGRGVNGFADNSFVSLTMLNTTAANSGADGMFVTALNNAQVGISVNNGDFSDSAQNTPGSDGVHLVTDTSADVVMQINNTPINNAVPVPGGTQDDGLVVESANNSTVLANISGSDLSNNLSNAIEATVFSGAEVTLNLLNSNGLNSGEDGIRFDVQTGGQLTINLQSSDFDFSGQSGIGNGILGFVRTGGQVVMNSLDSTVSNSAENGFELDIANAGSSFIGNWESGSFSDSGRALLGLDRQDAFHITAGDLALVDMTLFTTPSANTGGLAGTQQRGLWATVTTGADLSFDDQFGDLSGNLLNAINLTVTNPGSTATLNITDTAANNSGEDGFLFTATDSALLQASFLRSTLDSSGLAGVLGDEFDAIDGTLDTSAIAVLTFEDTAVTNAFHDGMRIDAANNSLLIATFDNSPLDGSGTNNSGDALRLTFETGADASIVLQNGSTATFAGDDAVFISATNTGTTVSLTTLGSNFSNSGTTATANGGNGIAAFVSDNATVLLNINDTPITNTVPTTPQLRGLLFDVQSGGLLDASFNNSPMTGHDLEGISGSVDGSGIADSTAILTLVDTVVDDNVTFGAIFNVTGDGDLLLDASGTSSFSNNGATGILANVDGAGSTFDLVLDGTTVDSNGFGLGGDGIAIIGDNGAFITGDITNASISNNANAGVVIVLQNGSVSNLAQSIVNSTIDGNGDEGILATVESGSTLLLNVVGGSISNNGSNGSFDNVNIFTDGAGSMTETHFQGVVADSSTRSGFNFTTLNGAMNLTQLRAGVSASNNANGNGVRFVADGAGTQAVLFMSDTSADGLTTANNVFSDNGTAVLTAAGGPDADLPLTGAGVFFQATNVDTAAIRFSGLADNNGNAADPLANRDIDGDGDGDHDGLFVSVDGATLFGFEIAGGSASGNVDQGIDLNVANVTDIDAVTKGSVITPPDVTIGAGGGISIVDVVVDGNLDGPGISIVIDGPITLNGDILVDNVRSTNNVGDGLLLSLTDVAGTPNVTIQNSAFANNGGHGINLDLENSPIGDLMLLDNDQGQNLAAGTLDFSFNNLIWTTFMNNNSTAGFDIAQVTLNLAGAGQVWRPDLNPFSSGFQPNGGSDITTGLDQVNGNAITPGTNPLQDSMGNVLPFGGVTPGSQVLTLDFTDFNPGEQLDYDLAHTLVGDNNLQSGNTLAGATGVVTLADGRSASGVFTAAGLNIVQAFGAIVPGISGNALDGIHIEQVNSDIASVVMDGNLIQDNGQSGAGSGINFAVMTNSDLGPVTVSNNTIDGNDDDGFRLVNVAPTGGLFDLTFDQNVSISGNGADGTGRGINLTIPDAVNVNLALTDNAAISNNGQEGVLVDLGQNSTLTMISVYGNTIEGNGGPGLRVDANLGSTVNLNLGDSAQAVNTFVSNGSAGAAITLNGTATANVTVENTTITGTTAGGAFGGDGLAIRLTDSATMPNLVIGDAAAANTSFSGNAGDGIGIQLNGFAQLTNPTVQNISSTGNTADGLNVLRDGSGVIDNFVITDSTFTGNQDGIDLSARFALLNDEYLLTNNTFDNNTGRGASFNAQADARMGVLAVNNTFDNNGGDGAQVTTVAVSPGDAAEVFSIGAWDQNSFNGNGVTAGAAGAGLELSGNGVFNLLVGVFNPDPLVFSNTFNGNAGDGIEINGPGSLVLIDAQVNGNNTAGTANGLAGIDINSVGGNAVSVFFSEISQNLGDGVEIDNVAGSGSTFTFFDVTNTFNGRDGYEFVDQGSGTLTITGTNATTSVIADNGTSGTGGRGVDIVAGGSTITNSTVSISNTGIERNAQEGVNVILTADAAQGGAANRDALSSVALLNGGALTSTPFLNFSLTDSVVNDNGQVAGNIGGAGLVMRVGTTRGGDGITATGGFASAGNGGVVANVTGNTLMGNFGADVIFESFVSISNSGNVPAAGSWTDQNENPRNFANDVFNPAGYQSDPIARLDLTFSSNTGEELDVTRLGAFYNNNDPDWKSRGITGVGSDTAADGGADDNGVFGTGARHRNAQRLAARNVDILFNAGMKIDPQLTIGGSDSFLFPGLGQSSFRVNDQTIAGNVFGAGDIFFVDNFAGDPFGNPAIYDSIFDSNGIFNPASPSITIFDVMPFGWSQLP